MIDHLDEAAMVATLQRMDMAELKALFSSNAATAARWIRAAAKFGVTDAQTRLGQMLLDGIGVTQDSREGFGWFMTAARDHDPDAMNMVGRCYENGWGVDADPEAAAHWFARAAAKGHAWAQYNLGHLYLDGIGVARDRDQAFAFYAAAAAQGHARAMNLVARCYEEGWGVAPDRTRAAQWYRRSAEAGYFRGQYNHATLLAAAGHLDEAMRWFARAAADGTDSVRAAAAKMLAACAAALHQPVTDRPLIH